MFGELKHETFWEALNISFHGFIQITGCHPV